MSKLSKALQKYYKRKGNRVMFANGQSLNQMATNMWEQLGFQGMDASLLSRVINGERLFTSKQLSIFSKILNIPELESERLLSTLAQEYTIKKDIPDNHIVLSSSLLHQVMHSLVSNSLRYLSEGKSTDVRTQTSLTESLITYSEQNSLRDDVTQQIEELAAYNLYLKARALGQLELPRIVIKEIPIICRKIMGIANKYKNKKLLAYAYVLLADAYYIAGGYSSARSKFKLYFKSIDYGRKAIVNLEDTNNEKLLAIRTIVASASHLKDLDSIMYFRKKTEEILHTQPYDNRLNALLLSATLGRGLAIAQDPNPFSIKDLAVKYFQTDMSRFGIYAASEIKEEIDALSFIKMNNTSYMQKRAKQGLLLANENNFTRHKNYFQGILKKLD